MLNMSLEGVLMYPSLVVAPINVNLGKDMFIYTSCRLSFSNNDVNSKIVHCCV